MVQILFTILMFACCGYACFAGGKEGRWTTAMLFSAGLLSLLTAILGQGWERTNFPVFVIDLLLLAGLCIIAARSRSYWPTWFVGLHLGSIATHIVTFAEPSLKASLYASLEAAWSIPELLIMTLGIMLDQPARRSTNA